MSWTLDGIVESEKSHIVNSDEAQKGRKRA